MISADLEAKVVSAIDAALKANATTAAIPYQIAGAWQAQPTESESTVAVVAVSLGTPVSITYSSPEVTFSGAISLVIRQELDLTATALVAFSDVLCTLFKTWQTATYQTPFTGLDLTNLSIDEVSIQQGQPPAFDRESRTVSLAFPFSLSGSYR